MRTDAVVFAASCRSRRSSRGELERYNFSWPHAGTTAAGIIDLLTAAVAEYHGAVVLHYDADFAHIAAITGQPQQWVVARGSID